MQATDIIKFYFNVMTYLFKATGYIILAIMIIGLIAYMIAGEKKSLLFLEKCEEKLDKLNNTIKSMREYLFINTLGIYNSQGINTGIIINKYTTYLNYYKFKFLKKIKTIKK